MKPLALDLTAASPAPIAAAAPAAAPPPAPPAPARAPEPRAPAAAARHGRRRPAPAVDRQLDWVEQDTGERRGPLPPAARNWVLCLLCGRPLKGHESRAAGLGPVCRGEVESTARGRAADPQTLDWLDPAGPGHRP